VKLLKAIAPAWIVMLALALFLVWVRAQLPDAPMVTHYDVHWRPNGWMPRDKALFVPFAVVAGVLALMTAAPFILPPRGALERSATAYGAVCAALALLIAAVQVTIVAPALHWPLDIHRVVPAAIGAVILVMGNFMTKLRYNLVYGIRTPWTLANEGVWDQTHRLAGPAFMAGGAFVLIGGLVSPDAFFPIVIVGVLVPSAVSVLYSYLLWSRLPPEDKRRMRAGA
jgi:uncharacterized membrane protein